MNWVEQATGLGPEFQQRFFASILIIVVLSLVRTLVVHVIWKHTEKAHTRYRWNKTSVYISFVLGFILVGRLWLSGIDSITTFLGLVTAGLAIALQDLVKGIAGWVFVLWRQPFSVGDRIQIGQYRGDVVDIRVFKFTLMEIGNWVDADQSTGRVIHLPNSMILDEAIANYSRGFEYIWNEIPVLVTFESNWKKAKQILLDLSEKHGADLTTVAEERVKEASKRYMIFYTKLTPTVYTSVKDCGVMLTMRYLISPRKRRGSNQAIWEDILVKFSECTDIDFAYPTQRFFNNAIEGKDCTTETQSPQRD